jgi:hypothetical protein
MNNLLELDEIVGVEELEDGEIFDLTVDEETPNYFTADGLLHHNSGKDFICSIIHLSNSLKISYKIKGGVALKKYSWFWYL